jgi:hypothetical protein
MHHPADPSALVAPQTIRRGVGSGEKIGETVTGEVGHCQTMTLAVLKALTRVGEIADTIVAPEQCDAAAADECVQVAIGVEVGKKEGAPGRVWSVATASAPPCTPP